MICRPLFLSGLRSQRAAKRPPMPTHSARTSRTLVQRLASPRLAPVAQAAALQARGNRRPGARQPDVDGIARADWPAPGGGVCEFCVKRHCNIMAAGLQATLCTETLLLTPPANQTFPFKLALLPCWKIRYLELFAIRIAKDETCVDGSHSKPNDLRQVAALIDEEKL